MKGIKESTNPLDAPLVHLFSHRTDSDSDHILRLEHDLLQLKRFAIAALDAVKGEIPSDIRDFAIDGYIKIITNHNN